MEENDIVSSLKKMLRNETGSEVSEIRPLAQSGSNRRYYRLKAGESTYIGTYVPDSTEGNCFIQLARGFREAGRDVPAIHAEGEGGCIYLQEDLGDRSLFSVLGTPQADTYIKETLLRLVNLQKTPESVWISACMSQPLNKRQVMWDLNYFKYEYLKPKETSFDEERLEDDFERLADRMTCIPQVFQGFMMRDCQSRNVMLTERGPVFIDFQGGRKGPVLYDAVSLLWQARAGFSREYRKEMLDFYCDAFTEGVVSMKEKMLSNISDIILFRTLQVLGAYGFRGLVQRKAHFILSIPGALSNLRDLLKEKVLDDYPELKRCAEAIIENEPNKPNGLSQRLTVEIFSFSYKKGYPEDNSGNGGGFMFDCRAMHNPGRYAEYKNLTGRDREVKDFLEARGEVGYFLKNAWSLTDPAIERYVTRGFTHLQIGFGCTGGQHRSVYCAERTASHVRETFPEAKVSLIHCEHPDN